jgi:hypothetical protein
MADLGVFDENPLLRERLSIGASLATAERKILLAADSALWNGCPEFSRRLA